MAASAAIHVRAPDAIVNGKSIADWTENWWQWALQAPSSDGPLTSGSPEATHYNNDGKVFFIAGGHDATIAVPAGKPILFPMVNAFATEGQAQYVQDIPGFYPSRGTLADEAAYVTNLTQNSIDDAYATLTSGGRTLLSVHWPESSNYAEESGVFALGAPKPGSYLASLVNGLDISDVPNLPNTSSSGDWLMLGPLPPGRYTLDFGGHIGTVIDRKRGSAAVLPTRGENVLGVLEAEGFELSLWMTLRTTRRAGSGALSS